MLLITLYIPGIAKLIQDTSDPQEMFRRLRRHWYLSTSGLSNRDEVTALIQQTIDEYPDEIVYGSELSQHIVSQLTAAGYVSIFGRTWGRVGRRR